MNESIEERIARVKKGKTTKSQKKLIEYLERVDYENIIYLSITELADSTKVAEATILRFCRLLGFNGYQEFKLNMAQEMSGGRLKAGTPNISATFRKIMPARWKSAVKAFPRPPWRRRSIAFCPPVRCAVSAWEIPMFRPWSCTTG